MAMVEVGEETVVVETVVVETEEERWVAGEVVSAGSVELAASAVVTDGVEMKAETEGVGAAKVVKVVKASSLPTHARKVRWRRLLLAHLKAGICL